MKLKTDIYAAYNLKLDSLLPLYQRLNEPVEYPDGMRTSLGIIYWGRPEHYPVLEDSIPVIQAQGIQHLDELLVEIKTAGKAVKFSKLTGIPDKLLRILKHDIEIWLPKPVELSRFERFKAQVEPLERLRSTGIASQHQLINAGSTPNARRELATRTGIQQDALVEMVKICDIYRMGSNLDHIRTVIYYDMGFDTWQKWAEQDADRVIAMFTDYISRHALEEVRMVPWPKEVRNGIEWAKMHLSIYALQW